MSSNRPNLKCIVIKKASNDKSALERAASNAIGDDPFESVYGQYNVIEPPYNLETLSSLEEYCGELRPALDAMSTNIEKLGHKIIPRPGVQPENENLPTAVKSEIALANNFFENAILDQEIGTFKEFRSRLRIDQETTGNAYIEVIPTLNDPTIPAGLNHLPSWTMRLRKQDTDFTDYEVPRPIQIADGKWVMKRFPTAKRFRQFVQIREYGIEGVFFKEWGDPRIISSKTGLVVDDGSIPLQEQAHEVIHLKLYSPKSPYGLPRTIGHLFSIFGTRAAEEINYVTFENNQIPAMALLATNVAVTEGSIARLKEFIEERVQGNKNYATIILIEGEPIGEGMRDPGSMKLELKPLVEAQRSDAMFQNYMEGNRQNVRRAFRVPPIFLGRADDFSRSTAEASRKLAEEQIFAPERNAVDDLFTNTLIARLGLANVTYVSNTPSVTDNYELTQLLATAERSGGLTPRIGRRIIEDILNLELPEVAEVINPDLPFSWTMLQAELSSQAQLATSSPTSVAKRDKHSILAELEEYVNSLVFNKTITHEQADIVRNKIVDLAA